MPIFTLQLEDVPVVVEMASIEEAEAKARELARQIGKGRFAVFEHKLWKVV